MAWYNGGDWSAVRVDRRGLILQQMCFAINERETTVGRTLTTWPNGVAANPSSWVFDGYRADRAGVVLTAIRDAIPSLYDTGEAERFVQSDGSNWTAALLFTAAGYGASWLAVDGEITNDVRPFLQTKAVIDALIYYLDEQSVTITVANVSNLYGYGRGPYGDIQAVYDEAVADLSNDIGSVATGTLAWSRYGNLIHMGGAAYDAQINLVTEATVSLKFPAGIKPVECPVRIIEYAAIVGGFPLPMTLDVNGVEIILDETGTDDFYNIDYILGDTMPFVNTYYSGGYWYTDLVCAWDYPSSHPFGADYTSDSSQRYLQVGNQTQTATVVATITPTYG